MSEKDSVGLDAQEKVTKKTYEWAYAKKADERSKIKRFFCFIYNPDTKEIFDRTITSWAGLILFYIIFYIILALIFCGCMWLFMISLHDNYPRWKLGKSLIGTSPGLGFRPMASKPEAAAVIWYNSKNRKAWVKAMNKFKHDHYVIKKGNEKFAKNCTYGNNTKLNEHEFCLVDFNSFKNCSSNRDYGYVNQTSLCVFLKLNRIYDWEPEFYSSVKELPDEIPRDAKSLISNEINAGRSEQVWISCIGQSNHDVDNIGKIEYIPGPGFPHYFYPYKNVKNYMSPLIAVHFTNPKLNILINVECRAWSKNIKYEADSEQREGSVHFEILIDG